MNDKATGKPGTVGGGSEMNDQTSPAAKSAQVSKTFTRTGSGSGKKPHF